ncbi:MAG: hypothetical protein Q9M37_01830 [Desulfonauticus sp.]|nr:hypothetical protein [Desulfonauticus sp.]
MKKVLFIFLMLSFLLVSNGICGEWTCDSTNGCNPTNDAGTITNFKTSNNVKILVNSEAQSYAAVSGHTNGDREYGAASDTTKIYYKSKTPGTELSDSPSESNSTSFDGWSEL